MVTDGQWVDYDKDGQVDLVITGEYMPIRVFHNEGGRFTEATQELGLATSNGWWNRIAIVDVNGDGYMDIVAANHGLNSRFRASEAKPVEMYVSDFDGNGSTEQVVSCYQGDSTYPMVLRHDLLAVLPALKKKYLKYESYKGQQMEDIFTQEQLSKAEKLSAYVMESSVFVNEGGKGFTRKALPKEAQLSVMYGIGAGDYDGDGKVDLVIAGNLYEAKPEAGIYDGSYGLMLKGAGDGSFSPLHPQQSGISIRGQVRDITSITVSKKKVLLFSLNNESLKFLVKNREEDKKQLTRMSVSYKK
jgi:hypothetical protein